MGIKKKKICILTATRAEYGLLRPIIKTLLTEMCFDIEVIATGAHLSPEFGLTYNEIEKDGIRIFEKIPILMSSDTPAGISKSMGLAMIGFADYFERSQPDFLVVLGDRYETFAVCSAALNARIPIAHLYGGETTEGAVDEAYRHAITKMSYLHFTSTDEYRKRVIQLGESPERVFVVGAIGVENALHIEILAKDKLSDNIGFKLDCPYGVVTFHPVTLENKSAEGQCAELLAALDEYKNMKFLLTKANSDTDGRIINRMLDEYAVKRKNIFVVESLGIKRYLSALKYASLVIGNSSSGIVEAPSFGIPTINIGDRQKGRIQASSVINCIPKKEEIVSVMKIALSETFKLIAHNTINPYGDGYASKKIVSIITNILLGSKINLKKKFYDINYEVHV